MHVVLARYCYRMPSVRLSVTLMYRGHTGWTRQSCPRGTPLKFGWNRGGVALLRKAAISLKRGKIGPRLLLMTNRKSHTRFRLVPKSTTLDDLEGPLRTVSKEMRLSEPNTKIWMKTDAYYQRRRCSPMTLDSGNMRFMRIFTVVLKIYVNFP